MKIFGYSSKQPNMGTFMESSSFEPDDEDAARRLLRQHFTILALWVAAIRAAPYFLSMWTKKNW
jgi:hypothetical protein